MAYGHFLPKAVREAPKHGMLTSCFNSTCHRGLLIEAAIALGEGETGVSLMQVVKEMDAGAVADSAYLLKMWTQARLSEVKSAKQCYSFRKKFKSVASRFTNLLPQNASLATMS